MTVDIIYLFQIIHIHKDQTAIVLLHQLCNHFLTGVSHRESGKKIKIFCFFLALHCIHNIGNEVADFKFHARKSRLVINFQISICDCQTILIQQSEKNICDFRIELSSSVFAYFFINCFFWKRITVNTAGIHCIIAVGNSNDPRKDRNLFPFQTVRITMAIITLMMRTGDFGYMIDDRNIFQNLSADNCMFLNNSVLFVCQSGWLV